MTRRILLALLLASNRPAAAQDQADTVSLTRDARVRVTYTEGPQTRVRIGTVETIRPDTLLIRPAPAAESIPIATARIARNDVSAARPSCWRVGGTAGSLLGLGVGALIIRGKTYEIGSRKPTFTMMGSMLLGGIVGAVVGDFFQHDRWVTIRLP